MSPRWPAKLWPRGLRLHSKLFFSYLAVIAIGSVTLLLAMSAVAPLLFSELMGQAMQQMMGSSSGMLGRMMSGMSTSLDEAALAVFRQTVAYSLLISTVAAIATAALASVFVSRRVVAPLRRLVAASRRIAAGHYAERVDDTSRDEIGELARTFNQMASSLEETERRRLALIGDVAHELRTPLATLEGYLEGLIDGVVAQSPETYSLLQTEARRLRRLVDDLQELSRAEARQLALRPRPVDAAGLLVAARDRLQAQFAEKGVDLTLAKPAGLPAVIADEDRAVQVLLNLLGNALRYTPAGGRVELSARRRGGAVEFAVADTGIGISAEHLPHVFERFYRSDRSRSRAAGGSGIGLTIAKHLVEAQGGVIRAESPGPDRGATFAFTLPIAS